MTSLEAVVGKDEEPFEICHAGRRVITIESVVKEYDLLNIKPDIHSLRPFRW